MKYGNWTLGQTEALLNLLGGEDEADAVLRGEKVLRIESPEIKLFDKNGRRIPPKGLQNNVCDPNKDFHLVQPQFKTQEDFAKPFARFCEAFHPGPLSAMDFEANTKKLIFEIKSNKNLANLLRGVYLPVILPKLENYTDYGTALEQIFLKAAEFSYKKQFPNRNFYNWRKGELANQVSIVEDSCHKILVEQMKQGIVYAIYFPNPLQGFSVLASREQMKGLPESLLLAGGFDSSAAQVMYPDTIARDWYTPGYDLAALVWRPSGCSLCFGARGDGLGFDAGAALGSAGVSYSSGLLFLGSA